MEGFAIIKIETDAVAAKDDIVQQFNSYMQATAHFLSFVHGSEGYFRLPCNGDSGISSAGIPEIGTFLQSAGYSVTGIRSAPASEAGSRTEVSFMKGGHVGSVMLSTVRIY